MVVMKLRNLSVALRLFMSRYRMKTIFSRWR